jgi:hypothetical protein
VVLLLLSVTLWHMGAASHAAAPLGTLVQVFSHDPVALLKAQYVSAEQPEALFAYWYWHWSPQDPCAYWQSGWASHVAAELTWSHLGAHETRVASHWQVTSATQSALEVYATLQVISQSPVAAEMRHMYEFVHCVGSERKPQAWTHCCFAESHIVSASGLELQDCSVGKRWEGCSTQAVTPLETFVWLKHCGLAAQAAGVVTLVQIRAHEDVWVFQLQSGLLRHWSWVSVMLHAVLHDAVVLSQLHDAIAWQLAALVPDVEQRALHFCRPLFHVQTAAAARQVVERTCMLHAVKHVADDGSQMHRPLLSPLQAVEVT